MMITDLKQEQSIPSIWRQAFRPFFLFGSGFAALAILAWGGLLNGYVSFSPYGHVAYWHSHEMMFGMIMAFVVGFLLTAVQNWTGLRATHGKPLMLLVGLWVAARLLWWLGGDLAWWWVALPDLMFLPLAAIFLARLIIQVKQWRNLMFVPVLLILTIANALTHIGIVKQDPFVFNWGMQTGIFLVSQIMMLIGGRVFPMFTANGTQTERVAPLVWLERTIMGLGWLVCLIVLTQSHSWLGTNVMAVLFAALALCNAIRAFRWRPWVTLKTPLVWSLHCAYWFIPAGFFALSLHYANFAVSFATAIHFLTAGAMGCLILAMIARVALGHSGRPLEIHWLMKWAFAATILGALLRVSQSWWITIWPGQPYLLASLLWSAGFILFLLCYTRILTTPRADGRPG